MRYWLVSCVTLMALMLAGPLRADLLGLDYPHNSDTEGIGCNSCHYFVGGTLPSWVTDPPDPDDLDYSIYNRLCLSCHDSFRATLEQTHSSQTTSEHYVAEGSAGWTLECRVCHWVHHQKQVRIYGVDTYLATGSSSNVTATTLSKTNAGWTPDAFKGHILIPDVTKVSYQYIIESNTTDTITIEQGSGKPGIVSPGVQTGKPFAVVRGKLIRDKIRTPNSGDQVVRFFRPTGANSFADGDTTRDGVCEVCHTRTTHFRNNGSGSDQFHANAYANPGGTFGDAGGTLENARADGTNCLNCHKHEWGFAHIPGGTGGITDCADAACHGGRGAHPGHLTNAGLACAACHNTADMPNFTDGGTRTSRAICLACHHDGTVVATDIVAGSNLPAWDPPGSLDCGGCHGDSPISYPVYVSGSPKANSHPAHSHLTCDKCHQATTSNGTTLTGPANHADNFYNLDAGGEVAGVAVDFDYTFKPVAQGGSTCDNISCHGGTDATWGASACLGCHELELGARAAIGPQFSANSHHIQPEEGGATGSHCHQCHWEAKDDGSLNLAYHGGSREPAEPEVDLVIRTEASRPSDYNPGSTAIKYTASLATRSEYGKINSHCLGCHNQTNLSAQPFGDGKKTSQYSWDETSVDARYSQASTGGTVKWGKYTDPVTAPNAARKNLNKEYSPHFRPDTNQRGWDRTNVNGVDGAISDEKTGIQASVLCFDCHNSHGSTAGSAIQPTTSYASATTAGGLLKDVMAGQGGYSITYKPVAGGNINDKNVRNPGASLCFDCHLNADGGTATKPWGYQATFGASQAVMGYYDSPYMGAGQSGAEQRYPYKALNQEAMGSHFGKSKPTALEVAPTRIINGLCTPCHDPHGVSPTDVGTCSNAAYVMKSDCVSHGTWTPAPEYGLPLLKGTWLTSPYKEDVAPASNAAGTARDASYPLGYDGQAREGVPYHIDQNTFGANIHSNSTDFAFTGVSQAANEFAGLCLQCHPKNSLTDGINSPNTGDTGWKTIDRIHESVSGWGANRRHKYSCSKCHTPHNGSVLPRLMVTNCLNTTHKGRVGYNSGPVLSWSGDNNDCDETCDQEGCWGAAGTIGFGYSSTYWGRGAFPGTWNRGNQYFTVQCHEQKAADQSWNNLTPWEDQRPAITTGPSTSTPPCNSFSVAVSWTTDVASGSFVDYGLTTAYGSTTGNGSAVTSHNVTLANLSVPNTYHYRVRSANASGETVSADKTFTLTVCPDSPPSLTLPTATGIGDTFATLGSTVLSSGSSAITARGTVWGGSTDPTGNELAEGEVDTGLFSHDRGQDLDPALPASSRVYYRGYAVNGSGTGYSPTGSFYTEPAAQAADVSFSNIGQTSMTVTWSRASGDGALVLMRLGAPVDTNFGPVDGSFTVYTANAAFGYGTRIGVGNYVVHKGAGTSVTVTNLAPATAFYVAVYAYKGTVDNAGVNLGTNYRSGPAVANQTTSSPGPGTYTYNFNSIGTVQKFSIPTGATNLQFSVKGGGGGGGMAGTEGLQGDGQIGHLVIRSYASAGITIAVSVGGGGGPGAEYEPGAGGMGYATGFAGEYGEDHDYGSAPAGAGGGGASAIVLDSTGEVLAEAKGGNGGRSDDMYEPGWNYWVGGAGGAGGGTDIYGPGTINPTGGGTGGLAGDSPQAGGNGQVTIIYDLD